MVHGPQRKARRPDLRSGHPQAASAWQDGGDPFWVACVVSQKRASARHILHKTCKSYAYPRIGASAQRDARHPPWPQRGISYCAVMPVAGCVGKRESAAVFEIARFLICETRHKICVGRHGCDSLATGSVRTVTLNGTAAATNYRQPLIVMIARHKA